MAGKIGRPPGARNKATAEIKEMAQQYAPAAVKELARLSLKADGEQARVSAIRELLDRAYGKATQPVSGDASNPIAAVIHIVTGVPDAEQP